MELYIDCWGIVLTLLPLGCLECLAPDAARASICWASAGIGSAVAVRGVGGTASSIWSIEPRFVGPGIPGEIMEPADHIGLKAWGVSGKVCLTYSCSGLLVGELEEDTGRVVLIRL